MAASLISTTVSTNFTNNTASKVTPSVTWLAGDLITVWGWTGDNAQTLTNPPTATGLTLTNVLLSSVASKAKLYLWTATAASGGSSTFTASSSVSTEGGLVVKVWRGASGFGTISSLGQGTTLAPTVSYTVSTLDSVVDGGWSNWNQNTNARTYLTGSLGTPTEDHSYNSATFATSGTWHNAGATATGAQTIGLSAPTMDAWLIAGIEILSAGGGGGAAAPVFQPHRMPLGA
jgi:hypothetical protein